ncbi:MAG: TolC family protein [Pseudomonadota bacterium]
MKMQFWTVVSAGALSGLLACSGASAQALADIMQDALDGSQTLAADRATLDAQREATAQARSSALPSVSIGGFVGANEATYNPGTEGNQFLDSLGVADFAMTGLDPATTSNGVSLTASQTLFAGGRVRNSIRAARASVRAAEASFGAGLEDTVFEIISAYYDVIRREEQSVALSQSLTTLREQEQAAKVSFDLGRATKTDVVLIEAQRADVEARQASIRAQVASARLNFEALTGIAVEDYLLPAAPPVYPDNVDQLIETTWSANQNLKAATAAVEAGEAQVRAARGQRLPAVELAGTLSYSEGNLIQNDSIENASIQLRLTTPLFSGGRISSEVRQAKSELRSSRFSQADLNRRLEAAVRAAYGEALAATMARLSSNEQLKASATAYEGVNIEYDLGKRTTIDVLNAEDDLLAARFATIDARVVEDLSIYNLLRLSGTLANSFQTNASPESGQ